MRPPSLCLLLSLVASPSCADDGDDPTDPTAAASTTAASGDSTSASPSTSADSTGAPLPDPGQQNDPCACEGDDPNACDATLSNCGDPLSCIAGSCRQACTSVDDTSCPEGTTCVGLEIGGVDLGFWCG
jgi:hypothetical protein